MTYSQGFIACVKVDGKILRETGDSVQIPFGSEYSIYLKNLKSVRAMVKVSVDGVDATEGTWLILEPNSSMDLERFIKGGNRDRGNRFKFIERTAGVEAHRGIGGEDGLIRVEYKAEKVLQQETITTIHRYEHYDEYWPQPWRTDPWHPYPRRPIITCNNSTSNSRSVVGRTATRSLRPSASAGPSRSRGISGQSRSIQGHAQFTQQINTATSVGQSATYSTNMNEAGITVPGSESNQHFVQGAWFATEEASQVLVLRLRGAVGQQVVVQAVTVDVKPKCQTCGKQNKVHNKFCSECGTSLNVI